MYVIKILIKSIKILIFWDLNYYRVQVFNKGLRGMVKFVNNDERVYSVKEKL